MGIKIGFGAVTPIRRLRFAGRFGFANTLPGENQLE